MTRQAESWYFAYGSNMQTDTFRVRRALDPLDVRVGFLAGFRVCFDIPVGLGRRGVANLAPAGDGGTWGVLYLLTPDQHERLDSSEGVPAGLYRRLSVSVETPDGSFEAETLISDRRDPSRGPSHRYLGILIEGARERGLPAAYVEALQAWDLVWDEREGAANPPGLSPR